jgi:hypothetical protein
MFGDKSMRNNTTLCLIFLTLLASFNVKATPQIWDHILINQQQFAIGEIPIPIIEGKQFSFSSSANKKGYAALWEIENNKLYLKAFAALQKEKVFEVPPVFDTGV